LLAALTQAPAGATRIRTGTLAERSRAAERIVVGRVTGVRLGSHPRYPRVVVTHVTLRVNETWKGDQTGTLSFMQFGDASARGRAATAGDRVRSPRIPGLPTYSVGEEVLLFLHRPSRAGLTSPVGGPAGKVAVQRSPASGALSVGQAVLEQGEASTAPGAGTITLEAARSRVSASLRREGRAP
jgi:hypothetical protein